MAKKKSKKQNAAQVRLPYADVSETSPDKRLPSIEETEAYIREHGLKVINPLSDFGFKRLLATERNKDILIHLLNAFIADDTGIITDVTYLPTELLGVSKDDKLVRFDLYCKNQDGDQFIVEMQNGWQKHYVDRLQVYTSLATVHNVKKGDRHYEHVPHVFSFNMMTPNMPEFRGRKRFFWTVCQKDNDNEIFSKKIVFYFVELSKFAAQLDTLDMSDERNRWLYMFTNAVYLAEQEVEALPPMQQRFYEECQITNFTDMEKQDYVKSLMDHVDVQELVECEREFAEQAGYERGMQDGMMQGMEKGMEKGREAALHQTAKNLLVLGLSPADVAKATGLSENDIAQLTN